MIYLGGTEMGTKGKWSVIWEEKGPRGEKLSKKAIFDSEDKRDFFIDNVLRKLPNFLWTTAKGFYPDKEIRW
jgi:muconolactone delta-isomerase